MAAVQQIDRLSFGTGRIYNFPPGGGAPIKAGILNDATVSLKIDQKEIYGEGGFAAGVADGHRTCEITTKQHQLNLTDIGNDYAAGTPGPSISTVAFDEAGVVGALTPFTGTLAHGATFLGALDLQVYVVPTVGATPYPVQYQIVTAGTEAAGVSASVSPAGVITFATGDAGLAYSATYQYGDLLGKSLLVTNTYQNSSPSYTMKLWKRDRSPIDGSVGVLQLEFFAVRPGGLTLPFKEGEYANYDKTYRGFANAQGDVFRITFCNT